MKKTILRQYARLIATMGGNVQKGQDVMINASLDQPEFVQMLVEECYRAGALGLPRPDQGPRPLAEGKGPRGGHRVGESPHAGDGRPSACADLPGQ